MLQVGVVVSCSFTYIDACVCAIAASAFTHLQVSSRASSDAAEPVPPVDVTALPSPEDPTLLLEAPPPLVQHIEVPGPSGDPLDSATPTCDPGVPHITEGGSGAGSDLVGDVIQVETLQLDINKLAGGKHRIRVDSLTAVTCLVCTNAGGKRRDPKNIEISGGETARGSLLARVAAHVSGADHVKNSINFTPSAPISSFFSRSVQSSTPVQAFATVVVHCKGYTGTSHTYYNHGVATFTANPLVLCDDCDTDANVKQGWRPHPTGTGPFAGPFLRAVSCTTSKIVPAGEAEMYEVVITDGGDRQIRVFTCEHCKAIPTIPAVRKRLHRATQAEQPRHSLLRNDGGYPTNSVAHAQLANLRAELRTMRQRFGTLRPRMCKEQAMLTLKRLTEGSQVEVSR